MCKACKSTGVRNTVLYPYKNVMVIERTYTYQENNENPPRSRVQLPSGTRDGWEFMGTEKDEFVKAGNTGEWTVREVYFKKGHVFQRPKA
mgnify:CR=1 FL=1